MTASKLFKVIFNNKFVIILLVAILVEPAYFQSISFIDTVYDFGRIVVTLVLAFLAYLYREKKTNALKILILMYLFIIINTWLQNGDMKNIIYESFSAIGISMLIELGFNFNIKKTLDVIYFLLFCYMILNLLTIFLYPEGMFVSRAGNGMMTYWQNWFLGYKNYPIRLMLPALIIGHVRSYVLGRFTWSNLLLYIVCWIQCLLLESSTATIGMFLFTIGSYFILHIKIVRKLFKFKYIIVMLVIAFFIIVVFQVQNSMMSYIAGIFGKDITFTGRVAIWTGSIKAFMKHPFIGYGNVSGEQFQLISRSIGFHPHNYILFVLVRGGIIELGFNICLIVSIVRKWKKLKGEMVVYLLILYWASMMVMGLAESFITTAVFFYPMLILGSNIEKIVVAKESSKNHYRSKYKIKFGGKWKVIC